MPFNRRRVRDGVFWPCGRRVAEKRRAHQAPHPARCRPDQKGSTGRDNRMIVEGVLWIVRTGSPWRDLPEAFGDWNSVFRRFSRWSIKGVWWRIFEAMSDDPDFEYLIVDSTIVRAHQV